MMRLLPIVVLALLSSCASTKVNYVPLSVRLDRPEVGVATSAAIGDHMLLQGTMTKVRGIELSRDSNIRGYMFARGFYPLIGEDGEHGYHRIPRGDGGAGYGSLRMTGGLLGPLNDAVSLRASRTRQELCVDRSVGVKMCDTETPYAFVEREERSPDDFQRTLIYSGRVGNKVRIGYREFSDDRARPAFSNEVEYDLDISREISYKGARLRILNADNEKIDYVVLRNFTS